MQKPESTITKSLKLTVPQIIDYCKNELGITFNLMDEEKAKEFLEKNNFLSGADQERKVYRAGFWASGGAFYD